EGRLPTGKANLSTSSLCYGGLRSAADLGRALGKESEAREYDQQADALAKVIQAAAGERWQPAGLVGSPITGPAGNHEYLLWLVPGRSEPDWDRRRLEAVVAQTLSAD
ncbi:MAG: hypothetical protein WCL59_10010, partial [Cyanobium sp. ELA507]